MTLLRRKPRANTAPDTAFKQGKQAAQQGLSIGMCPYSGWQQLEERTSWLHGYEVARGNNND